MPLRKKFECSFIGTRTSLKNVGRTWRYPTLNEDRVRIELVQFNRIDAHLACRLFLMLKRLTRVHWQTQCRHASSVVLSNINYVCKQVTRGTVLHWHTLNTCIILRRADTVIATCSVPRLLSATLRICATVRQFATLPRNAEFNKSTMSKRCDSQCEATRTPKISVFPSTTITF